MSEATDREPRRTRRLPAESALPEGKTLGILVMGRCRLQKPALRNT
jgi:hypothetical protein